MTLVRVGRRWQPAPGRPGRCSWRTRWPFTRRSSSTRCWTQKDVPAAEQMCFETSAKTGKNVDLLFETVFDMVVPVILRQRPRPCRRPWTRQHPAACTDQIRVLLPGRARPGPGDPGGLRGRSGSLCGTARGGGAGGSASRSPRQGPCDRPPHPRCPGKWGADGLSGGATCRAGLPETDVPSRPRPNTWPLTGVPLSPHLQTLQVPLTVIYL